jgi:hypothetical protein
MLEDQRTAAGEMPIEGDAIGDTAQLGERRLALLERPPTQVHHRRGAQDGGVIANAIAESIEDGKPTLVDYGFAVEARTSAISQLRDKAGSGATDGRW